MLALGAATLLAAHCMGGLHGTMSDSPERIGCRGVLDKQVLVMDGHMF